MSLLKELFSQRKKNFASICKANSLLLDYTLNKSEFDILRDIFEFRSYAEYFPFYQHVTIIDIGAHYGYFSLFAAGNSGSGSNIYAFEPDENNYKALCNNIEMSNARNIHPFNYAIDSTNAMTRLYQGKSPNHSLLQDYSLVQHDRYVDIQTKTLSQVVAENDIRRIDFLKMDCEGSEYTILETLPENIFDLITTVSMEFHDLKSAKYNGFFIVNILRDHHFEIVRFTYDHTSMGLNYGRIVATKVR
ncbi:MAG: FkbM family methyltransferase [Bacteroidales bacterium]|nr:FkbM family methyltransferase [Bacteroidales bacterium]